MIADPVAASGIAVSVGAVIMVVGYTLGKIFVYSTLEYAILKLPYEILQAAVGAVFSMVLCWKCGIRRLFENTLENVSRNHSVQSAEGGARS